MTDQKTSYTVKLTPAQMEAAVRILREGNYRPRRVEYTLAAAEGPDCQIALYRSGKCLVQGKGAADWITFVLEPQVLGEARLGYEDVLNPEANAPHMGVDESGKGDFFGPLVIAAAYVDEAIAKAVEAAEPMRRLPAYRRREVLEHCVKRFEQRAGKHDVVVGKETGCNLHGQQTEQAENRQRAQRVVPFPAPLAAQVGPEAGRRPWSCRHTG